MIDFFAKLKDNRFFQFSVVVILFKCHSYWGHNISIRSYIFKYIHLLDYAITVFFVIEILIVLLEKRKKKFPKRWLECI